jgi:hypothetical protein
MKLCLNRETNMRVTASALIGALLFALTLSASPQLHAQFHKDSSAPNHECGVTLIAAGNYDHSAAPVLLATPQPVEQFTALVPFSSVWVADLFLEASIFEHAPPVVS